MVNLILEKVFITDQHIIDFPKTNKQTNERHFNAHETFLNIPILLNKTFVPKYL